MSKSLINTHAGDDSDGKIWGIEGINILFILAGLLASVGLTLMLYRGHSNAFSFSVGCLPFVLLTLYVFLLRQGRPKAYDTDLLETLFSGSAWTTSPRQVPNPLYSHERA